MSGSTSIGLDAEARQRLKALKPTIADSIGAALDAFYDKAARPTPTRAASSTTRPISPPQGPPDQALGIISDGRYDAEYVEGVSMVGRVHARLASSPAGYIGAKP